VVSALSAADRALGQLGGITRALPNARLLIRSFISREAVLSSRIEGTRATLSNLFLFEINPNIEESVPDVREVANYVRSLDHGTKRLSLIPLSLNLIKELHAILLEGVRGSEKLRGAFRKCQVYIGPQDSPIEHAIYVPPPPEQLPPLLDAFEFFVNSKSELPLLVRLAMIHYQFEAIHPFEDGNGRLGRLMISLLLDCERALPYPVLYLSAFFERHREQYYDHLLFVSQRGDWSPWIQFFLRGVSDQAIDGAERAQLLVALRNRWAAECQSARASALLLKLMDNLFRNPFVNLARARSILNVQAQSAQNNINQLIERGIVVEVTGQKRNRVYAAKEVLRILDETPAFDPKPRRDDT
jgi:Fic family protein